jgi:hypothetical protein
MGLTRKLDNIVSPPPADGDIADSVVPVPIQLIAKDLGLNPEDTHQYGPYKAKVGFVGLAWGDRFVDFITSPCFTEIQ